MGSAESVSKVGYLSEQAPSGNTSRCYAILSENNLSLWKTRDAAPRVISLSKYKAIKRMGDSFELIPIQSNVSKMGFKCGSDYEEWCEKIEEAMNGDIETAESGVESSRSKAETPKSVSSLFVFASLFIMSLLSLSTFQYFNVSSFLKYCHFP